MNIVISGAGEVGRHAAEVLGTDGNNITLIDQRLDKLAEVEDLMDVRVMHGSCTHLEVLREAGCANADLYLAATHIDEVNLLSASLAKGIGARNTTARVHHGAYFENGGNRYSSILKIDHMVCPEQTTALAIAQTLRSPGAVAIERFGGGKIEMQHIPVTDDAPAVGKPLAALKLPKASRLASIERGGTAFLPDGATEIQAGDTVTLLGDTKEFQKACKLFDPSAGKRKRIYILGGTPMGVWLCRALKSRAFSVRLYVADRDRAQELADKLDWVTVLQTDVADPSVFEDEHVDQADAFVALTEHDEHNILGAARAKSMGANMAVAVLQRSTYLHLLEHVGIDKAFSPRATAVGQLQRFLNSAPVQKLATLAAGTADLYELTVPSQAVDVIGKPLREIRFPLRSTVAAFERGDEVHVPGPDDTLIADDTLLMIGPAGIARDLKKIFSFT